MKQIATKLTTSETIMCSRHFRYGLEDVRAGRRPRFDAFADFADDGLWAYERGRLFGFIAPVTMPLRIDGRLNPKAIALFDAACDRNLIR